MEFKNIAAEDLNKMSKELASLEKTSWQILKLITDIRKALLPSELSYDSLYQLKRSLNAFYGNGAAISPTDAESCYIKNDVKALDECFGSTNPVSESSKRASTNKPVETYNQLRRNPLYKPEIWFFKNKSGEFKRFVACVPVDKKANVLPIIDDKTAPTKTVLDDILICRRRPPEYCGIYPVKGKKKISYQVKLTITELAPRFGEVYLGTFDTFDKALAARTDYLNTIKVLKDRYKILEYTQKLYDKRAEDRLEMMYITRRKDHPNMYYVVVKKHYIGAYMTLEKAKIARDAAAEVYIGEDWRSQMTRNGKLIYTK